MSERKAYDSLTGKQRLFVDYYIINKRNGTQAYIDAGYKTKSRNTAAAGAYRLLKDETIRQAIKERAMPDQIERAINIHHLIKNIQDIADGKPKVMKWFGEEGECTPKHADQLNAGKFLIELYVDDEELKDLREVKQKAEIDRIKAQTELLLSRVSSGEDEQDQLLEDMNLFDPLDDEVSDE